jgi:molecular chaperone Hsp33
VLPPNQFGHFDVGGAVGKGYLHILRDIGLKEPYAGQVDIQTGEIAQDIAYYYALSEQVPTVCALGVLMNKDNTVRESGGYIIQLMPDCPEETISKLEEKLKDIPSVTDLLRNGETPESILKRILGDMDLHIFENMPVAFRCNCSRERVTAALIALGRKELSNIIADGKPETLNCAFCNTDYVFTVDEMKEILTKCTH